MIKRDLVSVVSGRTGVSAVRVSRVLDGILEAIEEEVSRGGKVSLQGFGVFRARQRSVRKGRDFVTGDIVSIPGKAVPEFIPGKDFRDQVEEGFNDRENPDTGG